MDWNQAQEDPIVDTLTKGSLYLYVSVFLAIQIIPLGIVITALRNNGVEWTTILWSSIGIFLFLCLILFKLILMIFNHYHKLKTIHSKGIRATGDILFCIQALWRPKIRPRNFHGNLVSLLCYTYQTRNGESIRLWSACSINDYKKVQPGQKLEILYDPDSPLYHLRFLGIL